MVKKVLNVHGVVKLMMDSVTGKIMNGRRDVRRIKDEGETKDRRNGQTTDVEVKE